MLSINTMNWRIQGGIHFILITARNEVWGKVICLHLSVILSMGGSGPGGGCLVQGGDWSWKVPGPRMCLVWGVPGPRGEPGLGGSWSAGCLVGGGAWSGGCLVETPPGRLPLRAVRMLLECILVSCSFRKK